MAKHKSSRVASFAKSSNEIVQTYVMEPLGDRHKFYHAASIGLPVLSMVFWYKLKMKAVA